MLIQNEAKFCHIYLINVSTAFNFNTFLYSLSLKYWFPSYLSRYASLTMIYLYNGKM